MSARVFDFHKQLIMSNGTATNKSIGEILLEAIPGSMRAIQALSVHDRKGTDWLLDMRSGEWCRIDCKIREEDPKKKYGEHCDDVALETWSVIEKKVIGWSLDDKKQTDYVFWLWKDTGRWCLVPFLLLVKAFRAKKDKWMKIYKVAQQKTEGPRSSYHSECVFVERVELFREIYRQSNGYSESLKQADPIQVGLFEDCNP